MRVYILRLRGRTKEGSTKSPRSLNSQCRTADIGSNHCIDEISHGELQSRPLPSGGASCEPSDVGASEEVWIRMYSFEVIHGAEKRVSTHHIGRLSNLRNVAPTLTLQKLAR